MLPAPSRALAAVLAFLAAGPLPAEVARVPDLHLAQATAPATGPDLVAVFSAWYQRHPIGSTVAPSQARILPAEETSGLPALPEGQRYAEFDGMIVKLDGAYKLLGIARLVPTATADAPDPAPEPAPASGGATAEAMATANVTVNIVTDDDRDEEDEDEEEDQGRDRRGSQAISIAEAEARGIRIPRGHQPAAGTCRLWIPGTPPGRQPRDEVSCTEEDIPEGALLIRG